MLFILLDQSVPRALGALLTGHTAMTAASQGWEEFTNGALMEAANAAGFALLITRDKSIIYQQNMKSMQIGLIVLSTNHWPTSRSNAALILREANKLPADGYSYVDCE